MTWTKAQPGSIGRRSAKIHGLWCIYLDNQIVISEPRVKIQSRRCWHQEMAKCVGVFATTTTTTTNDNQRPKWPRRTTRKVWAVVPVSFSCILNTELGGHVGDWLLLTHSTWPGMPPSWIFTFLLHALPWVVPSLSHCTVNSTFSGCFSNDEKQLEKMPTTTAGCKLKNLFVYLFHFCRKKIPVAFQL